jgi:hypothetical protein
MFLSLVGTSFSECLPPVLMALVFVVSEEDEWPRGQSAKLFAAGCSLGLACGKLTNTVYALGLTATLIVLWPLVRFRMASLLAYAAGGLIGFAVTGGYWAARLWFEFGNPVFPYYNAVFRSPFYEAVNFVDPQFTPQSYLRAAVVYPLRAAGVVSPSESPSEPRFAFVAICSRWRLSRRCCAFASQTQRVLRATLPSARHFWTLCVFRRLASWWLRLLAHSDI